MFSAYAPVVQSVARGETDLGITDSLDDYPVRVGQGAPIAPVFPSEGVPFVNYPMMLMAGAPHPHAAELFGNWYLSKTAQTELVRLRGVYSFRKDVAPAPGNPPLGQVNLWNPGHDTVLREHDALVESVLKVFGRPDAERRGLCPSIPSKADPLKSNCLRLMPRERIMVSKGPRPLVGPGRSPGLTCPIFALIGQRSGPGRPAHAKDAAYKSAERAPMKRRTLLGGIGASALARPSLVRAAAATTLRFVPQIDLSFLDPHWTTAYVTRNHGYLVFDTLYGQDGNFAAQPQMVEGHVVENDGKLWTLTLREGLLWHDGERVLARDCVASIRRWAKRDAFGDALVQATDQLDAPDDRTIRFRLKRPFALLPDALGKAASYMPAMMPERLANTDSSKQITDIVGSGPFRYKTDERLQGARNVYTKFEKYAPRPSGAPDWTAGPKIVHYDRVEWTTIPDSGTASAALQSGEQDWWEYAAHDLLPLLHRDRNIQVRVPDPTGLVEMLRPNHLQPPFNNPAIRRALWGGINQADFMQAIVGSDPAMYHTPLGFFCPGTPMASDVGWRRSKASATTTRSSRI
ncbi:MAG: ABC transporter substrate-binding protein [Acetobacteraceae bacterium]